MFLAPSSLCHRSETVGDANEHPEQGHFMLIRVLLRWERWTSSLPPQCGHRNLLLIRRGERRGMTEWGSWLYFPQVEGKHESID